MDLGPLPDGHVAAHNQTEPVQGMTHLEEQVRTEPTAEDESGWKEVESLSTASDTYSSKEPESSSATESEWRQISEPRES